MFPLRPIMVAALLAAQELRSCSASYNHEPKMTNWKINLLSRPPQDRCRVRLAPRAPVGANILVS